MELEKLLPFIELTNQFSSIKRVCIKPNGEAENDAEHSFQLAVVCWYLIQENNLSLDLGVVLKYALCHDLAEVYTGDIYPFDTDKARIEQKPLQEAHAREKIKQLLGDKVDIVDRIEKYEHKMDEESRFVCAVDKCLPLITAGVSPHDNSIHDHKLTKEMIYAQKIPAVEKSPVVHDLFEQLMLLREKKDIFYPNCREKREDSCQL